MCFQIKHLLPFSHLIDCSVYWHSLGLLHSTSHSPHRELKNGIARVTYGVSRVIVFLISAFILFCGMSSQGHETNGSCFGQNMLSGLDKWEKEIFPKWLHIIAAISSSSVTVSIQKSFKTSLPQWINYCSMGVQRRQRRYSESFVYVSVSVFVSVCAVWVR